MTEKKATKAGREAQATEYRVTLKQYDKACKHEEKYHGVTAICMRKTGHRPPCIHEVPKSYKEPQKHHHPKEQTIMTTKKNTEEKVNKGKNTKKNTEEKASKSEGKRKGNPEALAKAREAGAEAREARRARKIKLIAKENPKREGSAAHTRFALYKTGMTVGEFLDAGGTSGDLAYDEKHGYIEIK